MEDAISVGDWVRSLKYKDLQKEAKRLGIRANQKKDRLTKLVIKAKLAEADESTTEASDQVAIPGGGGDEGKHEETPTLPAGQLPATPSVHNTSEKSSVERRVDSPDAGNEAKDSKETATTGVPEDLSIHDDVATTASVDNAFSGSPDEKSSVERQMDSPDAGDKANDSEKAAAGGFAEDRSTREDVSMTASVDGAFRGFLDGQMVIPARDRDEGQDEETGRLPADQLSATHSVDNSSIQEKSSVERQMLSPDAGNEAKDSEEAAAAGVTEDRSIHEDISMTASVDSAFRGSPDGETLTPVRGRDEGQDEVNDTLLTGQVLATPSAHNNSIQEKNSAERQVNSPDVGEEAKNFEETTTEGVAEDWSAHEDVSMTGSVDSAFRGSPHGSQQRHADASGFGDEDAEAKGGSPVLVAVSPPAPHNTPDSTAEITEGEAFFAMDVTVDEGLPKTDATALQSVASTTTPAPLEERSGETVAVENGEAEGADNLELDIAMEVSETEDVHMGANDGGEHNSVEGAPVAGSRTPLRAVDCVEPAVSEKSRRDEKAKYSPGRITARFAKLHRKLDESHPSIEQHHAALLERHQQHEAAVPAVFKRLASPSRKSAIPVLTAKCRRFGSPQNLRTTDETAVSSSFKNVRTPRRDAATIFNSEGRAPCGTVNGNASARCNHLEQKRTVKEITMSRKGSCRSPARRVDESKGGPTFEVRTPKFDVTGHRPMESKN